MGIDAAQLGPETHPLTQDVRTPRLVTLLRWVTVSVFAVAAVCCVVFSLHWRMAVDTPVMHYVVFLMHHGLKPYSDITDNNMPGAYLTEAAAMAMFGGTDLAWRIYEFFLMAVLAGSAIAIARRWDWVAGVFAVGLFFVLHAAEGPQLAVERDLLIGVLLMVATAVLFETVDRRKPALMLLFGVASGVAAAIKPTALPLPVALLAIATFVLWRRGDRILPILAYSLGGFLAMVALVLAFLQVFHAWSGFAFVLMRVIPAYRDISRMRLGPLLAASIPRAILVIALVSAPLGISSLWHHQWDWRKLSLAVAAGFGLLSYLAQGKGYVYHRYIFLLYLLLLVGIEIFASLPQRGWPRWLSCAALLLALFTVPGHLRTAHAVVGQTSFELTLERDLKQLGKQEPLSGQVQCFDLVYGCLDALYHLQLVDSTGFTGDMLFFAPQLSPPVLFYRERFWRETQRHPAAVLVMSNGVFAEANSYAKVERWPAFQSYLATHYTLAVERSFPHERYTFYYDRAFPAQESDGYRIYVLNGSPLQTQPPALGPEPVRVPR